MSRKRNIIIVISSLVAIAIILLFSIYIFPKYIMPQINLSRAKKSFEALDYVTAAEFYKKSGLETESENINSYTYAVAMTQLNSGEYHEAATNFNKVGKFLDSENKIFDCGIALLDVENYESAKECFLYLSSDEAKAYKSYCEGMIAYKEKNYSLASVNLRVAKKHVNNAAEILPQVYFEYGRYLFNKKDYSNAKTQFGNAGDYSEAKTYITACSLMQAEELLKEGHLNEAKTAFSKLPQDFSFDKISVSKRVADINNASKFSEICGEWRATKNYIESRNVHKSTGIWSSWYKDGTISSQNLKISCILNSDGSVTIKGSVTFYRFTNYSSLNAYCNATQTTKSFTIRNVTKIPSNYEIDSSTTLKYSNGKFSISYSVRDDYSVNFYNRYSSSVTFGNKIETY